MRCRSACYAGVLLAGVVIVASGFALWKPVQLRELATLFGGYEGARLVHFFAMAAIAAFAVIHVVMALLVPKSLRAMIRAAEGTSMRRPRAPIAGVDPKLLVKDAAKLLPDPSRRLFLRNAASIGGLTLLTGCGITDGRRPRPRCAKCRSSTTGCRRGCSIPTAWHRPIPTAPSRGRSRSTASTLKPRPPISTKTHTG